MYDQVRVRYCKDKICHSMQLKFSRSVKIACLIFKFATLVNFFV